MVLGASDGVKELVLLYIKAACGRALKETFLAEVVGAARDLSGRSVGGNAGGRLEGGVGGLSCFFEQLKASLVVGRVRPTIVCTFCKL